ncbi:hypothetical protein AZE42_03955 [Rhizopogon vesiculosus]|uniref:RNase H type-1 domain-containing protein n=1 Tax=Rhizopogon vesiculosus TaxID=180088 RepID=A0A1J8PQF0_9AGAM|nr:hypothetical protein AZE42_03955 [Rhizopogon vesiculosus]
MSGTWLAGSRLSALRMVTLHQSHPLYKGICAAYNSSIRREFKSCTGKRPLHKSKAMAPIHHPEREPNVTTHVAQSTEEAIIEDTIAQEDLRVYSDSSAVDGGVGAAAVLMRGDVAVRRKRLYLGSDKEHTVYKAELIGMILAVQLLKEEGGKGTPVLGVDNQAAITATVALNSKSGHHRDLMAIFHRIAARNDHTLVVRWTPGHHGIPGNKAADKEAKLAAKGDSSEPQLLPKLLKRMKGTSTDNKQ